MVKKAAKTFDDPCMSDVTLLVSVEDLINMSMGPPDKNIVNFKLLQTVLHILARELRLLETKVDMRISEKTDSSSSPSSSTSAKRDTREQKVRKSSPSKDKALVEMKAKKAKEKAETVALKEKAKEEKVIKEKSKEEKAAMKEKYKEEKTVTKEKAREEKAATKERTKEEKATMKGKAKEGKATMKEKAKEEKAAMKEKAKEEKDDIKDEEEEEEREKKERMSPKVKEKYQGAEMSPEELEILQQEEKTLEKMSPSAKKAYLKQKELEKKQLEKMSPKEKEKFLSKKTKELKDMGNMTPKELEDYIKGRQKTDHGFESSISVSEVQRDNEKVLIVEKTSRRPARVGSIEVVTLSQFELLESTIEKLSRVAGPLPMPSLPDNDKLRTDLARGNATLPETMEAMQISARVLTAEKGINQLAGLLTQLASAGVLPAEITAILEDLKSEMNEITRETLPGETTSQDIRRKSLTTASMSTKPSRTDGRMTRRTSVAGVSVISQVTSGVITKSEMEEAIQAHKDDILKHVHQITQKSVLTADNAASTIKALVPKVDTALKLDRRISTLFSITSDYTDQLAGLDAGLMTQMVGFREQIAQIRNELRGGMLQLGSASSNSETVAVMELRERFVTLTIEFDGTVTSHQFLTNVQNQLGEDMRGLIQAVEMLREQKADYDEVLDGLRDKADISKLGGLMTEQAFMKAREELDLKLDMCYEKFRRQDLVWTNAIKELTDVSDGKADLIKFYAAKEQMQDALREMEDKLRVLALYLGQPKAAILTRMLSKNAACGICRVPALMEQEDLNFGKPPLLPALRPPSEEEPCVSEWHPFAAGDADNVKMHICRRWVGGSHTMLSSSMVHEDPDPLPASAPVKKYAGYGSDGRMYMMEDALQPCVECNVYAAPAAAESEDDAYCSCGPPKRSE